MSLGGAGSLPEGPGRPAAAAAAAGLLWLRASEGALRGLRREGQRQDTAVHGALSEERNEMRK